MSQDQKRIVLFDGICNLCHRTVKFVTKHDRYGKFTFIALQSIEGQDFLSKFNLRQDDFDSVIFIDGERVFKRSTAGLRILRTIGWPWKVLYVFIVIPTPVRDFIYDLIAKYRYQLFGQKHSCEIH